METKLFQVLDNMTDITVMVTKLTSINKRTVKLCIHSGYYGRDYFFYTPLLGRCPEVTRYGYKSWNDRTNSVAHEYIEENWDKLEDGSIINVKFILGEEE